MKQLAIFTIIIALGMLVAFTTGKSDTKVFVSNDATKIEGIIEQWSKYGYKVDKLISQSVGLSESYDGSAYLRYNKSTLKGDIILIMIK